MRGSMGIEMQRWILTALLGALLLFLMILCHAGFYRMARVYNWNGRRYCYLGYVPIRRKNGEFVIRIGEHMVDLSRTTAYRICVSKAFYRKNRYGGMVVYADGMQKYLIIEGDDMRF